MKRVSSETGCDKRDLNNTRVFRSQGWMPLWAGLLAAGLGVTTGLACRRVAPTRTIDGQMTDAGRLGESLPERSPPPLPPTLPDPDQVPPAPSNRRGGRVRFHLDTEPLHMNPLADPDASGLQVVTGLVYEPLLDCPSPGATGGYRPVLAESWEISADGLRISLRLRSGINWHDGHGFGVLDVQATLEPLLLAGTTGAILRGSLQDVAGIEIAAGGNVRLLLKRPSDLVLRALCDVAILPDHLLRGSGSDLIGLGKQPVGTGPFRFAGWDRGKRIRLTRFPGYWGQRPALEEITFEIDPDGARALMRTRRGEMDILPRVLSVHYPDQVDPVTLHGALSLARLRPDRWAYVAVNHRRAPLGDATYRRALSALWDRDTFARDLHQGLAQPIGAPPFANLVPAPAGRDRASAQMEAAGYRDTNDDGVRDWGGRPIRHSLLVASGGRAAAIEAHAFVFEARKAGLLVDLITVDAVTLLARLRKGDYDLALMLWEGRPDEDPSVLFGSNGPFNWAGYRSAEVDPLLDALRQATGSVQRRPLLEALGAVLARDQPVLFLYRFDVAALVARRVHGLSAVGGRIDLRNAWVDP